MRLTRQSVGYRMARRIPRMGIEMSEMPGKAVEVERIMALILERVEQRRAAQRASAQRRLAPPFDAPPGPELISQGPLLQPLTMVNRLQDPVPQGQIAPSGGALVRSAKRVIRRLLWPYHRGLLARQGAFNANVAQVINGLVSTLERSAAARPDVLASLEARLEEIGAYVVSLSSMLAAVGVPSERLQEIEEQLQALRNRLEKLEQALRSGEPA